MNTERALSEKEEKQKIIENVVKHWLKKYHEMYLKAKALELPGMIPSYSDMPGSSSAGFNSKVESSVIKKMTAEEWIKLFHMQLELLPKLHQNIIKKRYLIRDETGRLRPNWIVQQELNLSETVFFERRREALYWLGLLLKNKVQGEES